MLIALPAPLFDRESFTASFPVPPALVTLLNALCHDCAASGFVDGGMAQI
jgi:hypothetical protein